MGTGIGQEEGCASDAFGASSDLFKLKATLEELREG